MSREEQVEQVFLLLEELRETLRTAALGFVDGGRILSEIQAKKLFPKDQGFYAFITDNVGLGRSTINDRVNAWKRFGTLILGNKEFQGIDPTKLRRLLPYVKDTTPEEERVDLLYAASALSVKDLQVWLLERAGNTRLADTCTHSGWIEKIVRCSRCKTVISHTRDNYDKIMEKGTAFNPTVTDDLDQVAPGEHYEKEEKKETAL